MTANELAKLIKNTDGALWLEPYLDKIADTLIEQAQEIVELKNAKDYWCLAYKDVFNKLEFQTLSKNERPFICGLSGNKGSDNMNEYILVCPADGADGFAVYKKHKDYSAPGY